MGVSVGLEGLGQFGSKLVERVAAGRDAGELQQRIAIINQLDLRNDIFGHFTALGLKEFEDCLLAGDQLPLSKPLLKYG
jgi:hypothetical protein